MGEAGGIPSEEAFGEPHVYRKLERLVDRIEARVRDTKREYDAEEAIEELRAGLAEIREEARRLEDAG